MTWKTFFDISTMAHRHLLAAYAVVLVVQAGYFGWIAWNWSRTKSGQY
jgi:hypothetical protein